MDYLPVLLQKYVEDHTSPETELLQRINRETHLTVLKPRMLSGHIQGRLLAMFSQMIRPNFILELGTYTGYSALCLAEGLSPEGKLVTIDINEELESKVSAYFQASPYHPQISYQIGDAQEIMSQLRYTWDLVFIDADKKKNAAYFEQVLPNVRKGGFILVDNVLWSGKVAEEDKMDKATQTFRDFNDLVQQHPDVENVLLPVRDGLMILRKL